MRVPALICLLLIFCTSVKSEEIPLNDVTIVPGVRVGPIEKGITLFGLKTLFGGGQVKAADIGVGEGETLPGAKLFEGTDKELEILFNPEGDEKEVWDIRVIGKGWKFENGLKLGQTLEEVEAINGAPFIVLGFGWDYGGFANFKDGKLDSKVGIRFGTGDAELDDSLVGDREILSTDKKLRAAKPKVETISIVFR
ncbi:hypothetical protein EI77_01523 [Prosthecobacter fusiformis]|uniref:Uncharacterized protein n=1 Tax=Prosthecobacter fusiformis TaxID=48464 RepID=A0A4R7S5W9_9BACT|nr:hypothetical protein [Prosthecobacter fusiformis]TDU73056.1 hypothetical protein EI77_01523 [Prosthecobacter fusiformis]